MGEHIQERLKNKIERVGVRDEETVVSHGVGECLCCGLLAKQSKVLRDGFLFTIRQCDVCAFQSEAFDKKHDEFALYKSSLANTHITGRVGEPISEKSFSNLDMHAVVLHVNATCNTPCKICFYPDLLPQQDITITAVRNGLKRFTNQQKTVCVFGGEPTIHPKIMHIVKEVKASGNTPELFTNGIKLADMNFLDALIDAGLERVNITVDSFDKEPYERLRSGAWEWKLRLKGLENLGKRNIITKINATIAKGINDHSVSELMDYINEHAYVTELRALALNPTTGALGLEYVPSITELISYMPCFSVEHFTEFRTFQENIQRINHALGFRKPYNTGDAPTLLAKRTSNGLRPLFSVEELRAYNRAMENLNDAAAMTHAIRAFKKNKRFAYARILLGSRFNPCVIERKLQALGIVKITTCAFTTRLNKDGRSDMKVISLLADPKNKDDMIIRVGTVPS
ncbi:hypothetical protein COT72_00420 [archaeon CG10_big_fil_rev_8_21_14_0_10_43_11]|nr:MAG: hypothetical protein COT72_00420 [archaeon CG10_big_fil_rev_8_21_14_0_10_43_11]